MSRVYRRPEAVLDTTADEPVRIVLASDQKFLPFCAATMASVLANSSTADVLVFYLLTDAPLEKSDAACFEQLRGIHDFALEVVVVDASRFARVRTTPGISIATYYRLMLPDLLPADVDKVLYLDCDLAVEGRVRELFEIDVSDLLFLGVEDSVSRLYNNKFSVPDDAVHINGGVLLVNLAALRAFDFAGVVADYVERQKYVIELGDQQILNTLFHDRMAVVHPRWNVHGSMFERRWQRKFVGVRNHYTPEEIVEATANPAIIHYTYHRKPWQSPDHPKTDVYLRYLYMTGYADRFREIIAQQLGLRAGLGRAATRYRDAMSRMVERAGLQGVLDPFKRARKSLSSLRRKRNTKKKPGQGKVGAALSHEATCAERLDTIAEQARAQPRDLDNFTKSHEFGYFVGNASDSDTNGGELQNYKNLLRTNRISVPSGRVAWRECDGLFLCRWRPGDARQRAILEHAAETEKPLFLVETSFFAGCVTWAHRQARAEFRRPFGFIVDDLAYYYDATRPSRIRLKLADGSLQPSAAELDRARRLIGTIVEHKITKYNFMPEHLVGGLPVSGERPIVLVVDQTYGDSSISLGRASAQTFEDMLAAAIADNPHADILVKTHPDSLFEKTGRRGYFQGLSASGNVYLAREKVNPHTLIELAEKVYVVSSQFGFEALLQGKQVVCFGAPFYAGLGLTDDRGSIEVSPTPRSVEALFHIACVEMSHYVDPRRGEWCSMEDALGYAVELRERYLAGDAS